MYLFQLIIGLLPVALGVAALVWWQHVRADEILRQWANAAGVQIVSAQKRYFRTGPFFLMHGRGQFVYRIVVRDLAGAERTGWIRVGGWWVGVLSAKTAAIWDS